MRLFAGRSPVARRGLFSGKKAYFRAVFAFLGAFCRKRAILLFSRGLAGKRVASRRGFPKFRFFLLGKGSENLCKSFWGFASPARDRRRGLALYKIFSFPQAFESDFANWKTCFFAVLEAFTAEFSESRGRVAVCGFLLEKKSVFHGNDGDFAAFQPFIQRPFWIFSSFPKIFHTIFRVFSTACGKGC